MRTVGWSRSAVVDQPAISSTDRIDAQYEARVEADLNRELAQIHKYLRNVNTEGWVVPHSDPGYRWCAHINSTPQNYDGPAGWLQAEAARKSQAAFVEDAPQIGVQGWMTQAEFESVLSDYTSAASSNG
jgi:hypothetical protein